MARKRLVADLLAVGVELVELGGDPGQSSSGWRSSSMSVHAAVPDVVWWPANIIEMNMPVTMSVENRGVPSSSWIDIRTSSRSRSSSVAGGPCRRRSMISCTSSTSPGRAASRRRKLSMAA